jgi:hypothetical protein
MSQNEDTMKRKQPASAPSDEITLLGQILSNGAKKMPRSLARYLLTVGFSADDKARIHQLLVRNQDGALNETEKEELSRYVNVGCLIAILHAKARKALRRTRTVGA